MLLFGSWVVFDYYKFLKDNSKCKTQWFLARMGVGFELLIYLNGLKSLKFKVLGL